MAYDRISHMRFKAERERRVAESTRRFSNPRERDLRIHQEGYDEGYDAGWEAAKKYYYNVEQLKTSINGKTEKK